MASATDIAWAAGLFEGEGCFHARRTTAGWRTHLEMTVAMTDRDVLERLRTVVGVGTVTVRTPRPLKAHWKTQYIWRISGKKALEVAEALEPYLGERRAAKLREIRRAIAESVPQPRMCECCDAVFTPTRFDRERFCSERCRDRAKYLNRKFGTTNLARFRPAGN